MRRYRAVKFHQFIFTRRLHFCKFSGIFYAILHFCYILGLSAIFSV